MSALTREKLCFEFDDVMNIRTEGVDGPIEGGVGVFLSFLE